MLFRSFRKKVTLILKSRYFRIISKKWSGALQWSSSCEYAKDQGGQYVFPQPSLFDAMINNVCISAKQRKPNHINVQKLYNHCLHHLCTISKSWTTLLLCENWTYISYVIHQCAKFSRNPHEKHGAAINLLGKYFDLIHCLGFCHFLKFSCALNTLLMLILWQLGKVLCKCGSYYS